MDRGLFSRLDDELVMEVVARLQGRGSTWQELGATCQRLCRLLRDRYVRSLSLSLLDMTQLMRVPASRPFTTILHLRLDADIATQQDLAILSKGMWALVEAAPRLRSAELYVCVEDKARRFASAEGPLLALQGLPSLRELTLDELPDTRSLQHFVPLLTQLTCLEIACRDDTGALPLCCWDNGTPAPPLPALTGLRHLELRRFQAQDDFAAAALPGQLTYLKVSQPQGSLPAWWEQVGRCQALQELHVELQKPDPPGHPSLLLKQIAGTLTPLTSLHLAAGAECVEDLYDDWPITTVLERFLAMTSLSQGIEPPGPAVAAAAANWANALAAAEQGNLPEDPEDAAQFAGLQFLVRTPLDKQHGFAHPAEHIVFPPSNFLGLSFLRELHLDGLWWLLVSAEDAWEALAGCSTLQSLRGLHTCEPPPAGVTLPGVTCLAVTTGTSPSGTLGVLGAFPALRELQLVLVPQQEEDNNTSEQVSNDTQQEVVLAHLATARIAVHRGPGDKQLEPYFSVLLPALPALQRLELGWYEHVELLPQLPTLAALKSLSVLQVGCEPELTPGFLQCPQLPMPHFLKVVRTAPCLQQVDLLLSKETSTVFVEQQLVLGLQDALPALRLVRLRWCYWHREPPELSAEPVGALRPGLNVVRARYGGPSEGWHQL